MIDMDKVKRYEEAFICFQEKIENTEINWVLTGTFRLYAESPNFDINPNDIDILTDEHGIAQIQYLFSEYILKEFKYSNNKTISSHFGQLIINGVVFDIMSNVKNLVNNKWLNIPKLNNKEFLHFKNTIIPVLPLREELEFCKILNHEYKIKIINKLLEDKR